MNFDNYITQCSSEVLVVDHQKCLSAYNFHFSFVLHALTSPRIRLRSNQASSSDKNVSTRFKEWISKKLISTSIRTQEKNITGDSMLNAWCKGLCHLWKNIYKTWINHLFTPNWLQCPSQCSNAIYCSKKQTFQLLEII